MAPHLFSEAGLDPTKWSGLALGMGLDRALMLRKGIPDIRLLRSTDKRIQQQMMDLSPWKPVSQMPSIRRDISIVVPADMDAEVLGDRVRTALSGQADDLESVELLALTPYAELPVPAQERLRIREGQANALIRLVLRPLARTMTDFQANQIRDGVYLALHDGPVKELIAGQSVTCCASSTTLCCWHRSNGVTSLCCVRTCDGEAHSGCVSFRGGWLLVSLSAARSKS